MSGQGQTQMDAARFLVPAVLIEILRQWVNILLTAGIAAMIAYVYLTLIWEPVYSMTACYAIMTKATSGYETYSTGSVSYTVAETFEYLIESEILQDEVADALGRETLDGTISSEILEDTNVIYLTVTAGSPQDAYEIMQAVLECYPDLADIVLGSITLDELEEPVIPTSPVNTPDRRGYMMLAGAAAALAMAVLIGIFTLLRSTVKTESDFRDKLGVRRLATIPKERRRLVQRIAMRKDKALLITRYPISFRFTEGIERLRANFEYRAEKQECKVVLVTSSVPNEGKSTVSVNLALSLARSGKRVAFIDGDLRNPTTHRILKIDSEIDRDLGEFLQGECELSDMMIRYGKMNMFLLVNRNRYENASELLGSQKMSALIGVLRKFTDYIIIDTPPAGAMVDTEEVSGYADGAVLVVRQNTAHVKVVRDVLDSLDQTGIRVLGCVFNHVYVLGETRGGAHDMHRSSGPHRSERSGREVKA